MSVPLDNGQWTISRLSSMTVKYMEKYFSRLLNYLSQKISEIVGVGDNIH